MDQSEILMVENCHHLRQITQKHTLSSFRQPLLQCLRFKLTVLKGFLMLRFFNKNELLLRMINQVKSADAIFKPVKSNK